MAEGSGPQIEQATLNGEGSGPQIEQSMVNACSPGVSTGEIRQGLCPHSCDAANNSVVEPHIYSSLLQDVEEQQADYRGQMGEQDTAALRGITSEGGFDDPMSALTAVGSIGQTTAEPVPSFEETSRGEGAGEAMPGSGFEGNSSAENALASLQMEKECKDCKEVKPASEFSINKKNNRLLTYCRLCLSKRQKEYRRLAAEEKIQREKYLLEAAKDAERKRQQAVAARLAAGPPAGHKMCKDCGQDKPAAEFNRNVKSTTGLSTYCKPCSRTRVKASLARSAEQNPTAQKSVPKTRACITCTKRRPLADFESGRKKIIPGICNLCAQVPKKRQRKIQVPPGAPMTVGASSETVAPRLEGVADVAEDSGGDGHEFVETSSQMERLPEPQFYGLATANDGRALGESFSFDLSVPKSEAGNE
eukprot:TRINITY_DN2368_c0_g1_i1.p1 TRINITY_DN2368_c0_g1~~TRINITY_DN2368_c0_g1_i1.p1  ORF type:complete len:419 (+),score=82.74 TRINITY_DN2368_c0_g1_i1:306-1562(+)